MRERRPGVWEVRVVVGNDPATGASKQRSFTAYGDEGVVGDRRRELVARFGVDRSALYCRAAGWTVAELLERFLAAEHSWAPVTRSSHTSVARWLAAEAIGSASVAVLTPQLVEAPRGVAARRCLGRVGVGAVGGAQLLPVVGDAPGAVAVEPDRFDEAATAPAAPEASAHG